MGNKIDLFLLGHEARDMVQGNKESTKNLKIYSLSFEEIEALVEVFEMAIGELVPTKEEIKLYQSELEKIATLSPDDSRFFEAIDNVKQFQKDYGI